MRFVLFLAFLLGACGPRPGPRPYAPPDPGEMIDALRRHASRVRAMRAEARIEHRGEAGSLRATILLIAQRPGHLRLDAMSPFGSPVASLATDGKTVGYFDRDAGKFVRGPARACTLAWLVQLPLGPRAAVDVLLGGTELIEMQDATVSWDSKTREEVVDVRGPNGIRQRLRISGRRGQWRLRSAETYDEGGGLRFRVEHDDWRFVDGLPMPETTRVSDDRGADLRLTYKRREMNPELSRKVFGTGAPAGIEADVMDCE